MTETQQALVTAFEIEWDGIATWGLDEQLDWVTELIPGSDYFYETEYGREEVNRAQKHAFEQQAKGNSLYMITDDPDIVHWVAFNKKYMPIFKKAQPFLETGIFIEEFSPHDLTWEGE